MNKKLGLWFLTIGILVAGAGEFLASQSQPVVIPLPIHHVARESPSAPPPQPPAIQPLSPYPRSECKGSQSNISTSTWKSFTNPRWNITFSYPSNWKIDSTNPDINISGDGAQLTVTMLSDVGSGLVPEGAYEPYYCPRIVVGQHVDVGAYLYPLSSPTLMHVVTVQQANWYGFVFNNPSSAASATDPIFYTILDSVRFVKP